MPSKYTKKFLGALYPLEVGHLLDKATWSKDTQILNWIELLQLGWPLPFVFGQTTNTAWMHADQESTITFECTTIQNVNGSCWSMSFLVTLHPFYFWPDIVSLSCLMSCAMSWVWLVLLHHVFLLEGLNDISFGWESKLMFSRGYYLWEVKVFLFLFLFFPSFNDKLFYKFLSHYGLTSFQNLSQ